MPRMREKIYELLNPRPSWRQFCFGITFSGPPLNFFPMRLQTINAGVMMVNMLNYVIKRESPFTFRVPFITTKQRWTVMCTNDSVHSEGAGCLLAAQKLGHCRELPGHCHQLGEAWHTSKASVIWWQEWGGGGLRTFRGRSGGGQGCGE